MTMLVKWSASHGMFTRRSFFCIKLFVCTVCIVRTRSQGERLNHTIFEYKYYEGGGLAIAKRKMRCIHCILHFMHISFLLFMRSKLYPCYSPRWKCEWTDRKKFHYSLIVYISFVSFHWNCLAVEWNGIYFTFSCSPCRLFKDDDGSAHCAHMDWAIISFCLGIEKPFQEINGRKAFRTQYRARNRDSRWTKNKRRKKEARSCLVPKDRTGWCRIKRLLFRSHA